MNDHDLDRALADFGASRVQSTAPRALRQRLAAMPLPSGQGVGSLPTPTLRFGSVLGSATFVFAVLVVALFGGVLLAGVLTRPSNDPMPASATISPVPFTTDLLPGVDLVTEVVEPGVQRVLGDGVASLARAMPDDGESGWWFSVSAGLDGSVWLREPGSTRRLGDERVIVSGDDDAPASFESMKVDPQGTLWVIGPDTAGDYAVWSSDTSDAEPEWQRWALQAGTVRLDDFGGFWEITGGAEELVVTRTPSDDGGWRTRVIPGPFSESVSVGDGEDGAVVAVDAEMGVIVYQDGERWRRVRTPDGLAFELGNVGHDGTAWVRLSDGRLARFDGNEWATFDDDDSDSSGGDPSRSLLGWFGVAPDGSLWESGPPCNGLRRFDGRDRTTYLAGMCLESVSIDRDGIVWTTAVEPASTGDPSEVAARTVELYAITYEPSASGDRDPSGPRSEGDVTEEPTDSAAWTSALATEEVASGVKRFVPDGSAPWALSTRDRLAIGDDGAAYVVQEPGNAPAEDEEEDIVRPARLSSLDGERTWPVPEGLGPYNLADLQVGPDGTVWLLANDDGWATFADGEWQVGQASMHTTGGPLHALDIRPDGSAVALARALSGAGALPVNLVAISPAGEPLSSIAIPSSLATAGQLYPLAPPDVAATSSAVWVGSHLMQGGGGLARLDEGASDWVAVEPLGPGVPFETNALVTGPDDATLWALLVVETEGEPRRDEPADQPWHPILARYADGQWQTWGPDDGLPRVTGRWGHWYTLPMEVAPDGTVWMADHDSGLTSFDGSTFTTYADVPGSGSYVDIGDLAVAPDGSVAALIADRPNAGAEASLYIIDPEAAMTAD